MNVEEIGKYIRQKRILKNLTQEELANKIFVTNKAVSRWENGKSLPEVETLYLLSEELDVSINDILNAGKNEKEEIKKYYDKKRIKDLIPDILIFAFISLIPLIYIFFIGYLSIAIFLAQLGLENSTELLNDIRNAAQYTDYFIKSNVISFIIPWILAIISYIGYKCKNKLSFYIPVVINILIIIVFGFFNFVYPNSRIYINNILLEIIVLILNIIELKICKKTIK